MFTLNTSKGIFKVGFRHFNETGEIRLTECSLLTEDKSLVLKGTAYCNKNDNFNRAIGRKLSLTRMLELANKLVGFNKDDRTHIWDEYFKIHNQ